MRGNEAVGAGGSFDCDVFFPTDFAMLCAMYDEAMGGLGEGTGWRVARTHTSSREFFGRHARVGATQTRSGYNPLLEDFVNTRVFVGSRQRA